MKRKEPPTSTVTHCQPFCLSHTPCLRAGVQGHVLQKAGRACQRFLPFLFFLPLFLHHRFLYCLSTSSSSTHIPHPVKFLYEVLVKLLEHPKSGQFRMSGGRENNTRKQMWTKETRQSNIFCESLGIKIWQLKNYFWSIVYPILRCHKLCDVSQI